jgi:Bacterial Ig-like domain (group 2)
MHGSRGLRAVVVAVIALLALVPVAGVDAAATSGSAASYAAPTAPGFDISWPQCGGSYPVNPAFGIVGVNKGIVFSPTPCLASEVTWAGGTSAALYANTGNPGPALSTHWPTGQTSPQVCSAATPDTAECAYDYGYNAAADSYADAVAAFAALGLPASPAGSPWWLDVETSNSWRSDVTLNAAALSGAVDYLGSVARVASLGFYSTSYQWGVITGGTSAFSAYPSWVAGAADAAGASANCAGPGFTGGGVTLAQYPSGGFDADLRCSTAPPVLTTITVSPAVASVQTGKTQQFTATGLDQFGQPMGPQPAFAWSVSGGTISASGLFTAGTSAGGPFTVTATSGSVGGTASVTVTSLPADFSLFVSPASVSVRRGSTATYTVTVTSSNGFSGPVTLSLSGQPSGSTVSFSPNPATGASTLTVRASSSGPRGTFTLTITGKSGALTHTATTRLSVTR